MDELKKIEEKKQELYEKKAQSFLKAYENLCHEHGAELSFGIKWESGRLIPIIQGIRILQENKN